MEYVLIGKDGKSHDYFPTRAEALNALHEEEHTSPGLTQGWMIQAYGENGEELGEPEWADELLAPPAETTVSFVTGPEGLGCYRVAARAASSGTARSRNPWFRRPPKVAKRTRVLSEAGTAGAQSAGQS
jgi:hypothetical protein